MTENEQAGKISGNKKWGKEMKRRTFLSSVAAGAASLWLPRGARAANSDGNVMRFVPAADLATFDPIGSTSYQLRNAALLVFDTLYGIDEQNAPQLQMLESGKVSEDGLVWTFVLRDGLFFHDNSPVTAKDVVASLKRWAARDSMGTRITEVTMALTAKDDKTFTWELSRPFPKLPFALGKANAPCAFIMPERIAQTDPFQQITEYVGSGPMRFIADQWSPGAKAVFEKFDRYQPRSEPASWMAGGKHIHFDRVEFVILSDPASAVMALQNGEVDWIEEPLYDLLPVLRGNPAVSVGISNPYGNVGGIRLNHLQPPFNDPRARQALAMAINQDDYMNAMMGDQKDSWNHMYSYFTPGSSLYNETGSELVKAPRDYEKAKALLAESGYKGEPVVLMVAQERPSDRGAADVTVDLLTNKLGMKIDYVGTDFGSIQKRRQLKTPPSEGGWNMFFVGHSGIDCANPAAYIALRASGEKAWFGWPESAEIEVGIAEWFDSVSPEGELAAAEKINVAAMQNVIFALTGHYKPSTAWRNELKGVIPAPFPQVWGVSKDA
jgi:peptide/nickel transport system substrate-binding protein